MQALCKNGLPEKRKGSLSLPFLKPKKSSLAFLFGVLSRIHFSSRYPISLSVQSVEQP